MFNLAPLLAVAAIAAAGGCRTPLTDSPQASALRPPFAAGAEGGAEGGAAPHPEPHRVAPAADDAIVRGQDAGGFQMPPTNRFTAGSDHQQRGPMAISGGAPPRGTAEPGGSPYGAAQQGAAPGRPQAYVAQQAPQPAPPQGPGGAAGNVGNAPPAGYAPQPAPPQTRPAVPSIEAAPSMLQPQPDGSVEIGELPSIAPPIREIPLDVYATEARTGRFMIGGAVNSDAGVTGQIVVDEQNFDLFAYPGSFREAISGRAFRGAGQNFRLEAMPGNQFQRYMASWSDPYLLGYLPLSLSVNGFLFDRRYQDYDETRLGGRVSLGYRVTPDLSLQVGLRGENVDFQNPRVTGIPEVDRVVGDHDLYSGQVRLTHDTRDIPFAPTEGHLLEMSFEQVFGSFDYPRATVDFRRYFLLRQRPDGSGRQTLAFQHRLGFSGTDTPLFENFFAGGYSTLRGFDFRGASPVVNGFIVGGRFQYLGSVEYQFPLTADDMLKGVTFVDFGTVEQEIEINSENYRVAPGFGLRVAIPAMGPAPLAFDFAFPVAYADSDDRQVFSFFMGFAR